jgi:hypothetical protein
VPHEDADIVEIRSRKDHVIVKHEALTYLLSQSIEPGLMAYLIYRSGLLLEIIAKECAEAHASSALIADYRSGD